MRTAPPGHCTYLCTLAGPFRATAENTADVDPDGTVRLLTAILVDQPKLDGAACRGRHELFDPIRCIDPQHYRQEQIRRTEAARICSTCPARTRCPTVTTGPGITAVSVRQRPAPRRPSNPPPAAGIIPAA